MNESPRPRDARGRFRTAQLGGTFQSFHLGHERYIAAALAIAEYLYLGVTTDAYAATLKPYQVRSFEERIGTIKSFMNDVGGAGRFEIYSIAREADTDRVVLSPSINVAVVEATYWPRFERLNAIRRERGVPQLYLLMKPRTLVGGRDVSSQDLESRLSSASRTCPPLG